MQWLIKKNDENTFWQEAPESLELGVAGKFVADPAEATKLTEEARTAFMSIGSSLPPNTKWTVYAQRFDDALLVQNAVNPAGIARSLHQAQREVIAEGGDTMALKNDPACRLILFQLCYVMNATNPYSLSEYGTLTIECEKRKVKK